VSIIGTTGARASESIRSHAPVAANEAGADPSAAPLREEIVQFAHSLLGVPYKYAGTDKNGFDCSGFVHFVFKKHAIALSRSSRLLATEGKLVAAEEAQPGDLIFFTGTDPASTSVGHVGIVVSEPGEELRFIHSSSSRTSPGVRYDSLAKPNYQRRFLMVRRVL
jgi:cell wall-associated NlpC family hydrolase